MLGPVVIGTIRTAVPALVGVLLTLLLNKYGLDLAAYSEIAIGFITTIVIAAYYALVTLLERKVNRWFGILLGIPRPPEYDQVVASLNPAPPAGDEG